MKLENTMMTTLTLPSPVGALRLLPRDSFDAAPPAAAQKCILLFSDDDSFSQDLLTAASEAGRILARKRAAADLPRTLRRLNPAAVLVDLDSPVEAAWDAADSLLRDAGSPPLLLVTSRTDHVDFKTAIQAGSLIDKRERPARLLELANAALELSAYELRERKAMQRLVVRWLKPCNWSPQVIPLRRFWGINE
jgi:DNA-binding response OmpR family regulator